MSLFHYQNEEQKEYFTRLWKEYKEYLSKPIETRGIFPCDKLHFLVCDSLKWVENIEECIKKCKEEMDKTKGEVPESL